MKAPKGLVEDTQRPRRHSNAHKELIDLANTCMIFIGLLVRHYRQLEKRPRIESKA